MRPAALLDACALYPVGLRDTLLSVAQAHAFRPLWSVEILAESRGAMLAGFAHLIPRMTNDPADRHVLAAAVACRADVVVTWNVRHSPPSACRSHGIAVETPDEFLARTYAGDPGAVEAALARQAARYIAPAMTAEDLLVRHAPRLPHFINAVRARRS